MVGANDLARLHRAQGCLIRRALHRRGLHRRAPCRALRRFPHLPNGPEVAYLRLIVGTDQNIGRLDVAMDRRRLEAVQVCERLRRHTLITLSNDRSTQQKKK